MPPKQHNVADKDVVAFIKKGVSIPQAASQAGVAPSVMAGLYYRLEPVADPSLKITGTPKAVAKAIVDGRNNGVRWERLAFRSEKSVADVKAIYEEQSGGKASESYAGRGRRSFGSNGAKSKPAAKAAAAKAKPAAKAAPAKAAAGGRARTRAERQAKAGKSPS